ncbi:hypothetical protein [Pseudomonas brenneri]|jgi:hypothetical protein
MVAGDELVWDWEDFPMITGDMYFVFIIDQLDHGDYVEPNRWKA